MQNLNQGTLKWVISCVISLPIFRFELRRETWPWIFRLMRKLRLSILAGSKCLFWCANKKKERQTPCEIDFRNEIFSSSSIRAKQTLFVYPNIPESLQIWYGKTKKMYQVLCLNPLLEIQHTKLRCHILQAIVRSSSKASVRVLFCFLCI